MQNNFRFYLLASILLSVCVGLFHGTPVKAIRGGGGSATIRIAKSMHLNLVPLGENATFSYQISGGGDTYNRSVTMPDNFDGAGFPGDVQVSGGVHRAARGVVATFAANITRVGENRIDD